MTPDRLEEIRKRLAKATPGPWWDSKVQAAPGQRTIRTVDGNLPVCRITRNEVGLREDQNADFLAHAPEDIAHLLAVIDTLRAGVAASPSEELLKRRLITHFPSTYKRKGEYWLSCACEEFDRHGAFAGIVAEWAVHLAARSGK